VSKSSSNFAIRRRNVSPGPRSNFEFNRSATAPSSDPPNKQSECRADEEQTVEGEADYHRILFGHRDGMLDGSRCCSCDIIQQTLPTLANIAE
jgi:hypothetical protein